jgi:hypothetical protein
MEAAEFRELPTINVYSDSIAYNHWDGHHYEDLQFHLELMQRSDITSIGKVLLL